MGKVVLFSGVEFGGGACYPPPRHPAREFLKKKRACHATGAKAAKEGQKGEATKGTKITRGEQLENRDEKLSYK